MLRHPFKEDIMPQPLDQIIFDSAELVRDYPPQWTHQNKRAIYEHILSVDDSFSGELVYTRWKEEPLPEEVTIETRFDIKPGIFVYPKTPTDGIVDWHVNFADPRLFIAYHSALLAQDEHQAVEHPILGSLCEALVGMNKRGMTIDSDGRPTPITISGAQRRCILDTSRNTEKSRPLGLYGNIFARADSDIVLMATEVLSPPTVSNILAIAAPAYGQGDYTRDQIHYIISTAYTGFLAARKETARLVGDSERTVIHTGFWGCGAFGGDRILMTILQNFAAELADVDLIYYAFDSRGVATAEEAHHLYKRIRSAVPAVPKFIDAVERRHFVWGKSDGN